MDFMKLKATLSLDSSEYENGLDKAEGKTGKLRKGLAKFGKVSVAAIGAAATATGVLVKKSVDAYAEYEQLAGGVEKLFGKQASAEVMKYASEAYKTAGMSANQYLEQATSFSASLINSLGGDQMKAAKQADVAMRAISDNYNTFGGDIQNVQNAFQGFAKGNFMMLDNLKLGYGGTKTEMQRLIDDANEYAKANGMAADLSIDSFSDIVTAIDLVQQKQGIAGTTAKEASKTIEGSLNMTKAAWQNLLAGFANPEADIGQLVQTLMESASTAASNIMPAIMQALNGIGEAFTTILPEMVSKIPEALNTMVEPLLSTGVNLVMSLIQGLADSAPKVVESAAGLVKTLMNGLTKSAPNLMTSAITLVGELVIGLIQQLPQLITAGLEMITAFVEGLGSGDGQILDTVLDIISTLVVTIVTSIPQIVKAVWNLVKAMAETFSKINWLQLGKKAFNKVKDGISNVAPRIKQAIKNIVKSALELLGFDGIGQKVKDAFQKVVDGTKEKMDAAKEKVKSIIDAIKDFFPFSVGKIFSGWIPKIKLTASKSKDGTSASTSSTVGKEGFAKAMSQPYIFKRPTEFYAGEAGDEMLLGRSALKQDLADAVKGSGGDIVINLNYYASDDANAMLTDLVRGVRRYRMAGVI